MVRFMSPAAASFVMLDATAAQVFAALDVPETQQGIWLPEVMGELLTKVQAGIDAAQQQHRAALAAEQAQHDSPDLDPSEAQARSAALAKTVGLHQRLAPLKDMLTRALAAQEPVVWERS